MRPTCTFVGATSTTLNAFGFTLPQVLSSKVVSLLTVPREFRHWRDGLIKKGLAPSTVNRTCAAFQAALELAAAQDPRLTNQAAWRAGLTALPDAEQSRNVILPEAAVLRIVGAGHELNHETGLLIEVGGRFRVSQLARLQVADLQAARCDPRLMMPSARKGRGSKQEENERRPVPITVGLASALRQACGDRDGDAPLLTKSGGGPWRHSDHRHPFARAVSRAGLNAAEVTIYALRHSNIVRQLLSNTPIRVVAALLTRPSL